MAIGSIQAVPRLAIFGGQGINREDQATDRIDRDAQWYPLPFATDTGQIGASRWGAHPRKHLLAFEARYALGCLLHCIIHPTLTQTDPQPL